MVTVTLLQHLVAPPNWCEGCRFLGSVELLPGAGEEAITTGTCVLMDVECIGYRPISFYPGPHWTLTTMTSQMVEVEFAGGIFKGYDDDADRDIVINGVEFLINSVKD